PVVYDKNSYYSSEQAQIKQHGVSVYKHEEVLVAGAPKHHHEHEHGIISKITGMFHKKKKNREGRLCHDGSSSSDSDHDGCEPRMAIARKRCD
ncbi:hypothetical protein SOVF_216640, partial [Spinacia oleracea]